MPLSMYSTLFLTIDCAYHLEQKLLIGFRLKLSVCALTKVGLQNKKRKGRMMFRRVSRSDVSAMENAIMLSVHGNLEVCFLQFGRLVVKFGSSSAHPTVEVKGIED